MLLFWGIEENQISYLNPGPNSNKAYMFSLNSLVYTNILDIALHYNEYTGARGACSGAAVRVSAKGRLRNQTSKKMQRPAAFCNECLGV